MMRALIGVLIVILIFTVILFAIEVEKDARPKYTTLSTLPTPGRQLLFFHSRTCAPCQRQKPVIARLEDEGHAVERYEYPSDEFDEWGVSLVPTMVVVSEGGDEVERFVGFTEYKILKEALR